jgi:hypothetical protein
LARFRSAPLYDLARSIKYYKLISAAVATWHGSWGDFVKSLFPYATPFGFGKCDLRYLAGPPRPFDKNPLTEGDGAGAEIDLLYRESKIFALSPCARNWQA